MKKGKLHYGWIIAVVCFTTVLLAMGFCNSPYGLYQIPITTETGLSRTAFSLISSFRFTAGTLVNLAFGFISLRLGLRRTILLGLGFLTASMLTLSLGSAMPVFYLGGVLMGAAFALCSTASMAALLSRWFHAHRGTVIGIVLAASGVGGALFSPVVSFWIERCGWRNSFRLSAAVIAALAVLVFAAVRNSPAELGLEPIGGTPAGGEKKADEAQRGIAPEQAFRRPVFYLVALCSFAIGFLNNPIYVSVPAQVTDAGFSPEQAASVSSLLFLSIAVSKILLGWIHDHAGLTVTLVLCFLCNLSGILLLIFASDMGHYFAFAAIFGASVPLQTLIPSLLAAHLFGQRHYPLFLGILIALCEAGIAVGNPVLGRCCDLCGSYRPALSACAVVAVLVCTALLLVLRRVKHDPLY